MQIAHSSLTSPPLATLSIHSSNHVHNHEHNHNANHGHAQNAFRAPSNFCPSLTLTSSFSVLRPRPPGKRAQHTDRHKSTTQTAPTLHTMAFIITPCALPSPYGRHVGTASSYSSRASFARALPMRRSRLSSTHHRHAPPKMMSEKDSTSTPSDDTGEETVSLNDLKSRLSSPAPTVEPSSAVEELLEMQKAPEDLEDMRTEKQKEIDRLRAAEKFIEVDEGKWECTGCGYIYDPAKGDARNGVAVGVAFEDIPDDYTCGQCRTPKRRFVSQKKVIAGFADNQTYGFGSNTMTGGQKSLLIFGGLALCFLLLLSGYAMN